MTPEEQSLIANCVSGEKAAWDEFVRQYSNLVYHTVRKTLHLHHSDPCDDIVEDLYQEVFLSLLANDCRQLKLFRGDGGCTLASWLRMIAARRTIDQLRKSKQEPESLDATANNLVDGPADSVFEHQLAEHLAKAVTDLPARDKLLIALFFRHDLLAQDVASLLHMTVGAVYTQKSRILAMLRRTLENQLLCKTS